MRSKFDADEVDGKGRTLGWALALMEMLVDPMLVAWVPSWLCEQYEQRNPFFRACLRQALKTCNDDYVKPREKKPRGKKGQPLSPPAPIEDLEEKTPNPYRLQRASQTNGCLLRLVRRRMIVRFLRHKAEHPEDDIAADPAAEADSDDDGRARGEDDDSDDEDPAEVAKRLHDDAEIIRDELPNADGVDQGVPGEDAWARATAEQRLSAASSAPAASDLSLGQAPGGLHVGGVSVNPPGFRWNELPGNVCPSLNDHLRNCWGNWRKAGTALSGDGLSRGELDVWGRFAYDVVDKKSAERDAWLGEGALRVHGPRRSKPLRLILTGGAGSGKSTTLRALVRRRRERTEQRLASGRNLTLKLLVKQKRKKYTCVLSAPTGTASFQMKYGAATAHSTWGVPVGKCCLPLQRGAAAFERLQELLSNCDLAVFDEFSMLGKGFLGKVLYRARDAAPDSSQGLSLFGLDCILAGHLAQAAPIGDDPLYYTGKCKGEGLNKPKDDYKGKWPPSLATLVDEARTFCDGVRRRDLVAGNAPRRFEAARALDAGASPGVPG